MSSSREDWQVKLKRVDERSGRLFETGQWADCKFVVGQESNQELFNGHKLILAMSSPVFEAMFYGSMSEKNYPISIKDVQPKAFKALLQYIYTNEVELTSFDLACELCYCAKKYMLPFLVQHCTRYMWSDLCAKNVCRAYEFSHLFEEFELRDKCLSIIQTQTREILREPSFGDIERGTLMAILEQNSLNIDSELDLYQAVETWCKSECTRQQLDPSDQKNLRSVVGEALFKIRFLTLTPKEFAEGPGQSCLLTQEESFAILMNISSSVNTVRMPKDFDTSKNTRNEPMINGEAGPLQRACSPRGVKSYCKRTVYSNFIVENMNILDSSMAFTVNKNICIVGIVVPTQLRNETSPEEMYTEVVYAYLLDSYGTRLTYTYFTAKVRTGEMMEISFNRAIYIQKHKVYRIEVVFNKAGWYPSAICSDETHCDSVIFAFNYHCKEKYVRDDMIRSIVFVSIQ